MQNGGFNPFTKGYVLRDEHGDVFQIGAGRARTEHAYNAMHTGLMESGCWIPAKKYKLKAKLTQHV
jgi:hypothetical protein